MLLALNIALGAALILTVWWALRARSGRRHPAVLASASGGGRWSSGAGASASQETMLAHRRPLDPSGLDSKCIAFHEGAAAGLRISAYRLLGDYSGADRVPMIRVLLSVDGVSASVLLFVTGNWLERDAWSIQLQTELEDGRFVQTSALQSAPPTSADIAARTAESWANKLAVRHAERLAAIARDTGAIRIETMDDLIASDRRFLAASPASILRE